MSSAKLGNSTSYTILGYLMLNALMNTKLAIELGIIIQYSEHLLVGTNVLGNAMADCQNCPICQLEIELLHTVTFQCFHCRLWLPSPPLKS